MIVVEVFCFAYKLLCARTHGQIQQGIIGVNPHPINRAEEKLWSEV